MLQNLVNDNLKIEGVFKTISANVEACLEIMGRLRYNNFPKFSSQHWKIFRGVIDKELKEFVWSAQYWYFPEKETEFDCPPELKQQHREI